MAAPTAEPASLHHPTPACQRLDWRATERPVAADKEAPCCQAARHASAAPGAPSSQCPTPARCRRPPWPAPARVRGQPPGERGECGGGPALHKQRWRGGVRGAARSAAAAVLAASSLLRRLRPRPDACLPPCRYPGNLNITITYELSRHSQELKTTIQAVTDKPTPGEAAVRHASAHSTHATCSSCPAGERLTA